MAEQTPPELLQPCLLDRLTDDEPQRKLESRRERVISYKKYREGVLRDLEWLLNTEGALRPASIGYLRETTQDGEAEERAVDFADYPDAYKSVLNYGLRQFWGL